MFTNANLKTLVFVTNASWYLGTVPYYFKRVPAGESRKDVNYKLDSTFTRGRLIYQYISLFVSSFYSLFLAVRLGQKIFFGKEGEPSLAFLLKMSYYICVYSSPVFMQMNTLWFWKEIPSCTSQYITYFKQIQATYSIPNAKSTKCMKFFSAVILIAVATTLQNLIVIIKRPFLPHFLTSVLDDPKLAPVRVKLPIILFNIWIWALTWVNIWVAAFHSYMYMTCSVYVLKELDINLRTPRTLKELREPKTCAKTLRSLQVLHGFWEFCYQDFLSPMNKGAAMTTAILGIYGVIKLSGISSIVMGFAALFCLLYLSTQYYKFGKFNELSQKTLRNWQNSRHVTKYMRKLLQSIPDFRVWVAGYYYVTKTTVLMVFWTVLNNTITLLML